MSEQCEKMSKRPSALCLNFIVILPNVQLQQRLRDDSAKTAIIQMSTNTRLMTFKKGKMKNKAGYTAVRCVSSLVPSLIAPSLVILSPAPFITSLCHVQYLLVSIVKKTRFFAFKSVTDGPADRLTDRSYYRDARTHLRKVYLLVSCCFCCYFFNLVPAKSFFA